MGQQFIDYVIPFQDDKEAMAKNIMERIFIKRIKCHKPCLIMLVGDSGEGKSLTALRLADVILQQQGIDLKEYVDDVVIYTPLEYSKKFNALLYEERLKKINVVILDEAREVMKASSWNTFVNQAVADINATFRGIKPMIVIVITQFAKDVDIKIRRTLQYYGTCIRPLTGKVSLRVHRLWKDDGDIERPVLRKRLIRGYIVKDGTYFPHTPSRFIISRVRKEIEDVYEEHSRIAKSRLIKHKLGQLLKELEKEYGGTFTKVQSAVEYFSNDFEKVIERHRGKYRVKPDLVKTLDFEKTEIAEFQRLMLEKMKAKGVVPQNEPIPAE